MRFLSLGRPTEPEPPSWGLLWGRHCFPICNLQLLALGRRWVSSIWNQEPSDHSRPRLTLGPPLGRSRPSSLFSLTCSLPQQENTRIPASWVSVSVRRPRQPQSSSPSPRPFTSREGSTSSWLLQLQMVDATSGSPSGESGGGAEPKTIVGARVRVRGAPSSTSRDP